MGDVRIVIWEVATPVLIAVALVVTALLADTPPAGDQAPDGSPGDATARRPPDPMIAPGPRPAP